jgi:hypothetical protein
MTTPAGVLNLKRATATLGEHFKEGAYAPLIESTRDAFVQAAKNFLEWNDFSVESLMGQVFFVRASDSDFTFSRFRAKISRLLRLLEDAAHVEEARAKMRLTTESDRVVLGILVIHIQNTVLAVCSMVNRWLKGY